jgi:soluble lytic murein transglycosylase
MSPSTASATTRRRTSRAGAERRAAARRRAVRRGRTLVLTAGLAITALLVILAMPMFRQAVKQFTLPLSYASVIRQQAADKHLDPALIAGVIYAETKFDPRTSAAGAMGPMQIEPSTAEFLAHKSGATTFTVSDLNTPSVNIAYGSYYLRYLLDHYGGNTTLALAAYNGGEANVDRWQANARAHGHSLSISAIPFPETRDYVRRVLGAQRDYRRTYATELGYR